MKLLLVNPSRKKYKVRDFWDFNLLSRVFGLYSSIPIALPALAALTPKAVELTIIDEEIEDINFDTKYDLVGIGAMTPFITRAYEIADEFRKRGCKVVIGGIHASMLPLEAIEHADSVVIGEAEELWETVIDNFKSGDLKKFYKAKDYPSLKDLPVSCYDQIKHGRYAANQIQTTRGCPFDCEFCSVKTFLGNGYRCRSIEQVIYELDSLPKFFTMNLRGREVKMPKTLFIADDNIIGNRGHAQALFNALAPFKIGWSCQASINVGKDQELLAQMQASGCERIFIGFESLVQESLTGMEKKINKLEEYPAMIDAVQSRGMQILPSFIVGNDGDDESVFEKTVRFINENHLLFPMINVLTPFPGTKLFARLEQAGRVLHKNWNHYNAGSVCFKPRKMTAAALEEGHRWMLQELYSAAAMTKRMRNYLKRYQGKYFSSLEKGLEELSSKDKLISMLLLLKFFLSIDQQKRKFILGVIKNSLTGLKADSLSVIHALSFNDFVSSL